MLRIYFLSFLLLCSVIGKAQLHRFTFTEGKMGSPFTIILYCEDSAKAKSISGRCFSLVDSLVSIFSDYDQNSELNQLCRSAGTNTPFQCSPALFEILQLSKRAYEKSMGTFDITIGPLSRVWREARKQNKLPDSAAVREALALVDFNRIMIDPNTHQAILKEKGMQLDLGGIAQGYIGQCVIDFIKKQKVQNALVDVSGDIVCMGTPPDKDGWTVAINVPGSKSEILQRQLLINHGAVTTSGDAFQNLEADGKRYSHIIDPSTGYGITSQRNVTVIAKDGTTADWLTKACSLLPFGKAKKLVQEMNAEVLIVERKNSKLIYYSSRNFKHFWKKPNRR